MPTSTVNVTLERVYSIIARPPVEYNKSGQEIKPQNVANGKFMAEYEMKKHIPELQLPAVWLPHGVLGISNSEIVKIPEGTFGPFEGQLLVCDQGQSMIDRVFMEKVNGEY